MDLKNVQFGVRKIAIVERGEIDVKNLSNIHHYLSRRFICNDEDSYKNDRDVDEAIF